MWAAQWGFTTDLPVLGAGLLAAGTAIIWKIRTCPLPAVEHPARGSERFLIWGALAIFLVALAVRLWRLGDVPPVWWDEGVEAHDARCVAAGLPLEPLAGIYYHRSPLWLGLLAGTGQLLGFSFHNLKLVSVLVGALLPPLVFLLGCRLFGTMTGLLAGGWLIVHPWGLHLSRMLHGGVLVPTAAAGLFLLLLQPRMNLWIKAVAGGCLTGVVAYGYAAALQLPALAALGIWLYAPDDAGGRRRVLAVLLAVAIALGLLLPAELVLPGFWSKVEHVSALRHPALIVQNLVDTLPMFHVHGDDDLRHQYPPGAPVFSFFLAPAFSLGVALALRYVRQARFTLLCGWLLLALVPGLVSQGGARNQFRMIGAPPALALIGAVGGAALPAAFGLRLGGCLAAGLWAGSALLDYDSYFVKFPADPATAVWYRTFQLDAARDLQALARRRPLRLCAPLTLTQHPIERFLLFDELYSGRVAEARGPCGPLRPAQVYEDPWKQPVAILLVEAQPSSSGPLQVEYRTILDLAAEGDALIRTDRAAEALKLFRRYVRLLPRSGALQERLGFAALKVGALQEGERAFRLALERGFRLPATYDGLAATLFQLGRYAEAEAMLREALELAPGNRDLQADLEQVRRALNQKLPFGSGHSLN